MAFIVVGGQAKNVGKTALVCNIIAAFPSLNWSAVKITNHSHDAGAGCELRREGGSWSIWEQVSTATENDTSRFIRSGARDAWLVEADDVELQEAYASLGKMLLSENNVIVESNRLSRFFDPDLSLLVIDVSRPEFKVSAEQQLGQVDAVLWRGVPKLTQPDLVPALRNKPSFPAMQRGLDPKLAALIANLNVDARPRVRRE